MTFRRRQLLGWSVLAAAAALGGAWLLRLDYARKVSTDVLDLIPADEQSPELTLVRSLASQAEARTMMFELTGPNGRPAPPPAAARFAADLGRDPAFADAVVPGDSANRDALGRELFAQRFPLLFPIWLRERAEVYAATRGAPAGLSAWLARDTTQALNRFLGTPEALAFQDMIPADPLLLLPGALERLGEGLGPAAAPSPGQPAPALVWARLAASPLSEAGQGPAFAAIARATASLRTAFPGLVVADTGINRFAAASRARIEHEVAWLNAGSLAAVLAVAFTFIRRASRGLHLVPVVLLSVLGAWVAATLVFARLHIMVFAVGSLLTGVAIDYGFYLFMQPPAAPTEDYWAKVRRLAKPLLASCLTTVAGFALLLCSDLPFIRQLGVFVGAGLLCALAAAVVYFSTVKDPFLEARAFPRRPMMPPRWRRPGRRLLVAAWLVALPGLALLHWRDDIRDLEISSPELTREHDRISAQFGDRADRTVYLTYGATVAAARGALEKLEAWLQTAGAGRTRAVGLGAVVPTVAEQAGARAFVAEHPDFPAQLRHALADAGFDASGFASFFSAYDQYAGAASANDVAPALVALQAKLTGPASLLLHAGRPLSWFITLVRDAPRLAPPAATHTVSTSQLQSLNGLFRRYRQSALRLSLVGLAIIGTGVLLTYGWRDGTRIFAIPCGVCLGLFGACGWTGHPLNLFHLLGAFLGVCLTHNYAIFSATSAYRGEAPPVSVRLSALTTAASFGVLAGSGIPVVQALGSTVALMVLAALAVLEFEHLLPLGKKP
ncbi:MAG TPA: MMPL family transporter [Lacunisphaera sp.]|jgi:predicted exporter|nr:MMPL family transporter [Lacunisphaera sp.]